MNGYVLIDSPRAEGETMRGTVVETKYDKVKVGDVVFFKKDHLMIFKKDGAELLFVDGADVVFSTEET
jgi:co-chaperonin GroES (HSP10)